MPMQEVCFQVLIDKSMINLCSLKNDIEILLMVLFRVQIIERVKELN